MFNQGSIFCWVILFNFAGASFVGLPSARAEDSEKKYDTAPIRVGDNPAHEKLRETLNHATSVDFVDTPLIVVVDYLEDAHHIEFEIDQRSLDDLGLGLDTPVTRELNNVSLRSVLDLILNELDLTYRVDSEVLIITSIEEAETRLELVIYPVGDLLPPPRDGEFCHKAFMDMIVSKASPTSWDEVGGPGSISGFRDAVVVSQTQEVHRQIDELLQELRQLSRTPINDLQRSEQGAP